MATAFESIKQSLTEAITHAQTRGKQPVGVKLFRPKAVDVSGLQSRLGFSQEQFASRFGFSVASLRHWERGDRAPSGASLVLLNVIERDRQAVMMALQQPRVERYRLAHARSR